MSGLHSVPLKCMLIWILGDMIFADKIKLRIEIKSAWIRGNPNLIRVSLEESEKEIGRHREGNVKREQSLG